METRFSSLSQFARKARQVMGPKGPFALVLIEDEVEIDSTLAHCAKLGFKAIAAFGNPEFLQPLEGYDIPVIWVDHDMAEPAALSHVVNTAIAALGGEWLHYCYNAEYLFFPFCETRTVGEMLAFNAEERRASVLTCVIDLYSNDLGQFPNGVSRETAHLDRAGYYALARYDDGTPLERQLDFFGGLRWRFEEHVPWTRRRIDRVGLFQAARGLQLREDRTFNMAEYNTYACPWHNNITATICSFRTAKALLSNPGSKYEIPHFWWWNSTRFEWESRQLLDLGFMEPGQWF